MPSKKTNVFLDINVNTDDGAVDVGSFENDFVKVTTTSGNIHLDPFKSSLISLASITGNIMLKTATQASAINLSTHSGVSHGSKYLKYSTSRFIFGNTDSISDSVHR